MIIDKKKKNRLTDEIANIGFLDIITDMIIRFSTVGFLHIINLIGKIFTDDALGRKGH